MHKFVNKIHFIFFYFILLGILIFEMLIIEIPITYSFSAKAEKIRDNYYFVTVSDIQKLYLQDNQMYVSANKNEMVMRVDVKQEENRLFFENQDSSFKNNYNQIYTYEIVKENVSLLECIFSKGGKTNE